MVELTTYLPDFENGQLEENDPIFLPRATGGSNKASHTLNEKERCQYKGVKSNYTVLPC